MYTIVTGSEMTSCETCPVVMYHIYDYLSLYNMRRGVGLGVGERGFRP